MQRHYVETGRTNTKLEVQLEIMPTSMHARPALLKLKTKQEIRAGYEYASKNLFLVLVVQLKNNICL